MECSKWNRVLAPAYTGGMNSVIMHAMRSSPFSYLLDVNDNFLTSTLTVHAYREVGTAVEAAVEIRTFDWNGKLVSCKLTNITL